MDEERLTLVRLQEIPQDSLILLTGAPGGGKSTFCHQAALNSVATETPVIFVTTERTAPDITALLKNAGLADSAPSGISFVDAFSETVGAETPALPHTIYANSMDLNSLSIAITRLREKTIHRRSLLIVDSLTSPYLFNGTEVVKFMRLFLSKFAVDGNAVLAVIDEGCGKEEDLVTMKSIADGIVTIEAGRSSRVINIVKHPKVAPNTIEVPVAGRTMIDFDRFAPSVVRRTVESSFARRADQPVRTGMGDFVNLLWRNLAFWSGMLWDPRTLPTIAYQFDREFHTKAREAVSFAPWHMRLLLRLLTPRSFREVKGMKRYMSRLASSMKENGEGLLEYLEELSGRDKHHFRVYENSSCWGFDNIGSKVGFLGFGDTAGMLTSFDQEDGDWNIVETECLGTGTPYCEYKLVRGETDELKAFLESTDGSVVAKAHQRLMDQLYAFLLHSQAPVERPTLGNGVLSYGMVMVTSAPALISGRYRMAMRMGGAKVGKEVAESLMNAGVPEDEVISRVVALMEYCKVGKISLGETIRIRENCETFGLQTGEPACFFTTGFLNGLLSVVKNYHVRERRCVGVGDPYCEWEIA